MLLSSFRKQKPKNTTVLEEFNFSNQPPPNLYTIAMFYFSPVLLFKPYQLDIIILCVCLDLTNILPIVWLTIF